MGDWRAELEIEYRYLDMDAEKFVKSFHKLIGCKGTMTYIRCLSNYRYNQVLYAASQKPFTEVQAKRLSQEISKT